MNFKDQIQKCYQDAIDSDCVAPESKIEFIGNHIFDFTTYSSDIDEILGRRMLNVCEAIATKKTFEFQSDDDKMIEYITMCNMPFLDKKLSWGTSIRGAWFEKNGFVYEIDCMKIPANNFDEFILDLIEFEKA